MSHIEAVKKWQLNNPDYWEEYYKNNKDIILSKNKKWNEENKERMKEYKKQWCQDNHNRLIEKRRERYKNNKETILKQIKEYRKTEKGKGIAQRAKCKRRSIFKNIINTLTSKEWLDILKYYDYKCVYCGCGFDEDNLPTKDHIMPISKGGDNTKENIVPACRSCNSKKNNKIINEKEILLDVKD